MFKNILFYTICGLAKIRSVHMYVIPWIHWFEPNCRWTKLKRTVIRNICKRQLKWKRFEHFVFWGILWYFEWPSSVLKVNIFIKNNVNNISVAYIKIRAAGAPTWLTFSSLKNANSTNALTYVCNIWRPAAHV